MINDETYEFDNFPLSIEGKYKNEGKKYFAKYSFIIANGVILLGCIYVLLFILIPIIKYRIMQFAKQKRNNDDIRDRIEGSNAALLKERFTSENN